ncbi:MAG: TonB-dependent receptor [Chitinophagaceae bacterium]|nr:MAG: TonB-dependent receptor [Chitinophagaceae bacterium]
MKHFITGILLMFSVACYSQECNLILKGHVEDLDSREKLYGATVFIPELNKEIVTDAAGDFMFEHLCPGSFTLRVSHVGCETVEQKIVFSKSRHIDIDMPHKKNTLGEVTVSGTRGIQNTGSKKELSGRDLEQSKGENLAESLSRLNGVTMLQTGSTVSKPVIHGLHSSRILTINNGVRQEGQQWGNEHAPEIDPFIAGKLLVIKGVDELKYGSDAIGGVVLVEPKALISSPGYNSEINLGYFTNNRQWITSAMYEQQLKNIPQLSYRLQGTYKRGANSSTAHYRLNNTGSEEKNFSVTVGWKKHRFNTELFYSFFDTKLGIFEGAHIGNLTDLQVAIDSERPASVFTGEHSYRIQRPYQAVQHQLLKSKSVLQNGRNKFMLLASMQSNYRKEFDIVRNPNNKRPQLDLAITTISEELSWEHAADKNFVHTVAFNAVQQVNSYTGRYFIPAYDAYNFGGYYIGKWNNKKWDAQAGVRYDNKNLFTSRILSNGMAFDEYNFNFSTLAGSLNAGYKIREGWKVNAGITLATRAPQVNELLSNGIHHGSATYETGDIHLKPERSVNFHVGSSFTNKRKNFSAELEVYSNHINDFIYQQPKPAEPVLTISGAFPLLVYQQNNARLQGIDFSTKWNPVKPLQWEFSYSMLRARNTDSSDWLIRMPADRLRNVFTIVLPDHKHFTGTYFSAEHNYVLEQTRVPDELNGKQDYKAAPPAYGIVHAYAGTKLQVGSVPLGITLGVRNLFNKSYRDYLNSMRYFADETGRNFQLKINIPINNKI